jgi:hypothetical protein
MLVFWLLLLLVGACLLLLMPFLIGREFHSRYRGSRAVTCPENRQQVAVGFDALHAAVTRLAGSPDLRLAECTRWPERADCGQDCLPEARRTEPYTKGEVAVPKTKKIYHLPVLIAAFFAWVLGAVWHSHYLFRSRWIEVVGLNGSEVHQLVWRLAPHMLSLAVPLLFAYGVAWLLVWNKEKGVLRGVVTSMLLWAAVGGTSLAAAGLDGVSGDLLTLEGSYTFLASGLIGATIGGLSGKLVEQSSEK